MDDLKGIEGNFENIGKTPQKDLDSNKATIASILGIKKSKELVSEGKEQFFKILKEIRDFDGTEYTNMVQYLKYIWKTLKNK
jgi:geranylgeranyl diphosphate synthase type II